MLTVLLVLMCLVIAGFGIMATALCLARKPRATGFYYTREGEEK